MDKFSISVWTPTYNWEGLLAELEKMRPEITPEMQVYVKFESPEKGKLLRLHPPYDLRATRKKVVEGDLEPEFEAVSLNLLHASQSFKEKFVPPYRDFHKIWDVQKE